MVVIYIFMATSVQEIFKDLAEYGDKARRLIPLGGVINETEEEEAKKEKDKEINNALAGRKAAGGRAG